MNEKGWQTAMNKEMQEYAEQIRRELHETVDRQIDAFLNRMENGETVSTPETELPLSIMAAYFKGKKPVAILYPDGMEAPVSTWKKAAVQLLRHCAEDEQMRGRLEEIRGKVFGRNRLLFGDSGYGMDVPLEFCPDMFLESKFDTETLLKVITKRIFDPIGYDYSGIRLKVENPALKFSEIESSSETEGIREEISEEKLQEEEISEDVAEEDFFPTM